MGSWSNATRQGGWDRGTWESGRGDRTGPDSRGVPPRVSQGWGPPDVAVLVVAFVIRWELGLAFLALKFWHQASGHQGSVFSFAKLKWEALVAFAHRVTAHQSLPFSVHFGPKSSGNAAFDAWRKTELDRIDAERNRLLAAEREFMSYRDDLLHARDREAFDRFMQARTP